MILSSGNFAGIKNEYKHNISIISSLDEITDQEIASITKGRSFYVSKPWLTAIERLRGQDTAYITLRDEHGELLGVLPIYWGKPSVRGYYETYKRFLEPSKGDFNEADWSPTFIIGSRAAYSCEFLISNTIKPIERDLVLMEMINFSILYAKNNNYASISALYVNKQGHEQLQKIISNKNDFFIAGANAVIDIKWKDFDEYLSSLNSNERRKVRKEERIFFSKGYTIESSKLGDSIEIFAELFANHENKYGHKTSPKKEAEELQILTETANDYSHVLILKLGDQIVGCLLLFLWEDTIYARTVGFDFEIVGEAYEYFNLAYYAVIKFAINEGYKLVDYGMGTYRAKLKRGARLEQVWGYTYSNSKSSPFKDSEFKNWNKIREEAVKHCDISTLERIEFP